MQIVACHVCSVGLYKRRVVLFINIYVEFLVRLPGRRHSPAHEMRDQRSFVGLFVYGLDILVIIPVIYRIVDRGVIRSVIGSQMLRGICSASGTGIALTAGAFVFCLRVPACRLAPADIMQIITRHVCSVGLYKCRIVLFINIYIEFLVRLPGRRHSPAYEMRDQGILVSFFVYGLDILVIIPVIGRIVHRAVINAVVGRDMFFRITSASGA